MKNLKPENSVSSFHRNNLLKFGAPSVNYIFGQKNQVFEYLGIYYSQGFRYIVKECNGFWILDLVRNAQKEAMKFGFGDDYFFEQQKWNVLVFDDDTVKLSMRKWFHVSETDLDDIKDELYKDKNIIIGYDLPTSMDFPFNNFEFYVDMFPFDRSKIPYIHLEQEL